MDEEEYNEVDMGANPDMKLPEEGDEIEIIEAEDQIKADDSLDR